LSTTCAVPSLEIVLDGFAVDVSFVVAAVDVGFAVAVILLSAE